MDQACKQVGHPALFSLLGGSLVAHPAVMDRSRWWRPTLGAAGKLNRAQCSANGGNGSDHRHLVLEVIRLISDYKPAD